jgi:glycosyltransferase involved in cell wall biosynthesis
MSRAQSRGFSPVAIREVGIDHPLAEAPEASGYQKALVFFTFRGAPVGQALLPVVGGKIPLFDLNDALLDCGPAISHKLLTGPAPDQPTAAQASVVVCTRDRPKLLRDCLQSLTMLHHPPREIIVVDSAPSSDATCQLSREFPGVHYTLSRRPGLNVARNLGLAHAQGEYVAFTDDDARPDPGWLEGVLPEFAHPLTSIVCGITLPAELNTEAQWVFERYSSFGRGFCRREFTIENANLFGTGAVGAGVNMTIRKTALEETGPFEESLDGGTPTESGGDQEFFFRVLARGHRIIYQPAALVWHRHRRSVPETARVLRGYGTGVFAWWTKALVVDREFSLLLKAPFWFIRHHLWLLLKSALRVHNAPPLWFSAAEASGAVRGPLAYARSRWFHPAP